MSTIATLRERAVAPSLTREQQQPSVAITTSLRPDFALGDALAVAQDIVQPAAAPRRAHDPARRSRHSW